MSNINCPGVKQVLRMADSSGPRVLCGVACSILDNGTPVYPEESCMDYLNCSLWQFAKHVHWRKKNP